MKDTAAIILAAGEGTRMKSNLPKALHPLLGVPMIFYVINSISELGKLPTIMVTGRSGNLLKKEIRKSFPGRDIRFVVQGKRLGTGHAVRISLKQVPAGFKNVLVLMGDMPLVSPSTIKRLADSHLKNRHAVTIAAATLDDPTGYGRIIRSFSGKIIGIREERDCTATEKSIREINSGVYCFFLPFLNAYIKNLRNDNAKKEYYLTDIIQIAASVPSVNVGSISMPPHEARGVNDRKEIAEAEDILLRSLRSRLMQSGVSITMPETVYAESSVRIAPDTVLGPFVMLKGNTSIGGKCTIGAGSIITDATIEDNVTIGPYCIIERTTVRRGSRIEPFVKLPGRSRKKRALGKNSSGHCAETVPAGSSSSMQA